MQLRISARTEYAVRATARLARCAEGGLVKAERIAVAEDIPVRFLLNILGQLRQARIVRSRRGVDGGYGLARPPERITIGEIVKAVGGVAPPRVEPPGSVAAVGPDRPSDEAPGEPLEELWVLARRALESLLAGVTLADLVERPPGGPSGPVALNS